MAVLKEDSPGEKYVALLRGINVGGKNRVPMKQLTEIFVDCGCRDVATYIQSGNVIFRGPRTGVDRLAARVQAEIAARMGPRVPVILRSAAEMQKAVGANPFAEPTGQEDGRLHVYFLADKPSETAVHSLDPERSPGDSFRLVGREIYLLLPNGMARTKLTNAYFDSKLETTSTARNWATTLKLLEMVTSQAR